MTLIELMVVVVIATILMSIAVPSYMSQVRQSRRIEAKTALLDLAGREERFFSTSVNGANYSQTSTDLGYPVGAWPQVVGSGYYTVTVCGLGPGMSAGCKFNRPDRARLRDRRGARRRHFAGGRHKMCTLRGRQHRYAVGTRCE